ncbi:hypothetical protein AURDEDRAFT_166005 [Auricularia subglabra TFB-10046 SS5]|nr:hypothetical protein AURDEDRAFT_166005 [Auricularia subglabra TFB-10046 SS5]
MQAVIGTFRNAATARKPPPAARPPPPRQSEIAEHRLGYPRSPPGAARGRRLFRIGPPPHRRTAPHRTALLCTICDMVAAAAAAAGAL